MPEMPPEMKEQADKAARIPGARLAATLAQNPLIAGVISALSPCFGTPVSSEQVMMAGSMAEKHIDKVEAEDAQKNDNDNSPRPGM